ncbi:MAG: hypothetical protein JST00_43050 [Deltaproteobacteria bacterium]|nr:hypothetical protein [Deltaproteobacteria bacterium]
MPLYALALFVVSATACGGESASEEKAPPKNPDELVTIASGLYGQVVFVGDLVVDGKSASNVVPNQEVFVYSGDAKLSAVAPAPGPLASAKTDAQGFYQLQIADGAYQVCAAAGSKAEPRTGVCTRFEVKGSRVRADYCRCMNESWRVDGAPAKSSSTAN